MDVPVELHQKFYNGAGRKVLLLRSVLTIRESRVNATWMNIWSPINAASTTKSTALMIIAGRIKAKI
jgi:hypothetical protein